MSKRQKESVLWAEYLLLSLYVECDLINDNDSSNCFNAFKNDSESFGNDEAWQFRHKLIQDYFVDNWTQLNVENNTMQ